MSTSSTLVTIPLGIQILISKEVNKSVNTNKNDSVPSFISIAFTIVRPPVIVSGGADIYEYCISGGNSIEESK